MTVLVSDSFNRTDTTTTLGTADTGQSWVTITGNTIISGNKATGKNTGTDDVKIATTASDCSISAEIYLNNVNAAWISTRVLAWNSLIWCELKNNGSLVLYTRRGNSTVVTLSSQTVTYTAGKVLKIVANGSTIQVYYDNVLKITVTETWNQTVTTHGMGFYASSSANFIDNFLIEDLNTGGTTLTVSLSDSITLSELITKSPSKRLSDSITLSDTLSKSLTVTVVDTVSIGDSSTASQGGKSASLSDTVIVTDAIVKKVISTYKNDAVNLSDVDSHTATKQLLDSIASSDTITVSNGKSIILSDSITVTDAIFKAVNVIKSDSITLADSTSKTAKIGVYDVLITSDDLSILNPQAPAIIGTIHLKGSRTLNVYLVGSQELNVNLKGGIS